MASWEPTLQSISGSLGEAGGVWNDARHREFGDRFTERFRTHRIPVRARYIARNLIQLQCGATIPRWEMSRIAVQLHDEAKALFGENSDVDIYETYISIRRCKVAELRTQPNGRLLVRFDRQLINP
jgi:hypothetical protein